MTWTGYAKGRVLARSVVLYFMCIALRWELPRRALRRHELRDFERRVELVGRPDLKRQFHDLGGSSIFA
eukprot:5418373-Pyramimonas_sp.AAC.1